ncbi:unnamed protein product [Discosporangium mesarthrocarpum]
MCVGMDVSLGRGPRMSGHRPRLASRLKNLEGEIQVVLRRLVELDETVRQQGRPSSSSSVDLAQSGGGNDASLSTRGRLGSATDCSRSSADPRSLLLPEEQAPRGQAGHGR